MDTKSKYCLENRETLNGLIEKTFDILERVIVKEHYEKTYNNLSQSIPDGIELDKHLILYNQSQLNLKDAKQALLDLMQSILETNSTHSTH